MSRWLAVAVVLLISISASAVRAEPAGTEHPWQRPWALALQGGIEPGRWTIGLDCEAAASPYLAGFVRVARDNGLLESSARGRVGAGLRLRLTHGNHAFGVEFGVLHGDHPAPLHHDVAVSGGIDLVAAAFYEHRWNSGVLLRVRVGGARLMTGDPRHIGGGEFDHQATLREYGRSSPVLTIGLGYAF